MIRKALLDYEKLLHKKIKIGLEDSTSFEFEFKDVNFMHLVGLHKLDDVSYVQKFIDKGNLAYNAKRFYTDIKKSVITDEDFERSLKYEDIKNRRLNYFKSSTILRLIHNEEIIKFNPLKVVFKNDFTKLKDIEYIFYEIIEIENNYLQFCIGFDKKDYKNHPCTFFMEKTDIYVNGQDHLNVISLSIEAKDNIEFKINWELVRLSMKKNSHYKKLLKLEEECGFVTNEFKIGDLDKLNIDAEKKEYIEKELRLLRYEEIQKVYLNYVPGAEKWTNAQKGYLMKCIDESQNKNFTPKEIISFLDQFSKNL